MARKPSLRQSHTKYRSWESASILTRRRISAISPRERLSHSNCRQRSASTAASHIRGNCLQDSRWQRRSIAEGILWLAGTPAVGSEGDYSVMITIAAPYKNTIALKLSVGVPQPPVFTSQQVAVFYLNRPSTFTIRAVGTPAPTLVAGWLPDWLTFETQQQANSVTGKLSGKPPYFPGPFSLSFKASSASGEKEQTIAVLLRLVEGDLNNDDVVNCGDQQYLKNVLRYLTVNPGYEWTADVNQDGWSTSKIWSALGRLLPGNPVCH